MSEAPIGPRRGGRQNAGPDLRQLRQLVTVIDQGSLNRAATALGIAQPTLSRSIARLEDQIGVSLFDRTGVSVRPTQFGRMLAERARGLIDEANDLGHWLQLLSKREAASVRMGVGPVPRDVFLYPALEAVVASFPNVKVAITVDSAEPLYRRLVARELDLIIINALLPGTGHFDVVELMSAPYVVVARPGHPLAGRGKLSWRDLQPYALVEPSIAQEIIDVIDPDIVDALVAGSIVCADFTIIREMVRNGAFLSIAPRPVFADDVAKARLIELDLDIRATYRCAAIINSEGRLSPVLTAIVDLIGSIAGSVGTTGFEAAKTLRPI